MTQTTGKAATRKKAAKKKTVKRAVKRPVKKSASRPPAKTRAARPAAKTVAAPPPVLETSEAPETTGSRDVAGDFWGEESRRGRRRALRQHHIVRNVSVWSVLKVSVIFYLCAWIVVLIAGVVLWRLSDQAGLIGNVESFWAEATGQDTVEWDGTKLFRSWLMAGSVLALASAAVTTLFAALFNLICDLTGGIRYTVLEVESHERRPGRAKRGRS